MYVCDGGGGERSVNGDFQIRLQLHVAAPGYSVICPSTLKVTVFNFITMGEQITEI